MINGKYRLCGPMRERYNLMWSISQFAFEHILFSWICVVIYCVIFIFGH